MKVYLILEMEDGLDPMIVAAYLREESAQQSCDRLGSDTHSVESIEVMDA